MEIFRNPGKSPVVEEITAKVGDEEAYVSIIQLAEVADWATINKAPPDDRIDAVKGLARIVPLDERICLSAAEIKSRRRRAGYLSFGLIDGVVLGTARSIGQRVLTLDKDFEGEEDCILL